MIVGRVFSEDFENLFLIEKREKSEKLFDGINDGGLMVILMWAFSVVVINKHFEIIGITENLTSNMLWSFCFTMLLYSVVLALIPYLISFFLRKTLIQIRLFLVLISIWYLIFIIPQFSKAGLL